MAGDHHGHDSDVCRRSDVPERQKRNPPQRKKVGQTREAEEQVGPEQVERLGAPDVVAGRARLASQQRRGDREIGQKVA